MTRRILPVACLLCWTIRSVIAFTPKHVPFRIPTQVGASPASIQQRLVQYGLAWPQTPVASNVTRVPGCVATVYIQAFIHHNDDDNDNDDDRKQGKVQIVGNADAIVSRGLLSLLAEFLSDKTLEETLALDPTQLTTTLALTSALSPGRNDGMANMLRVVQQQLRGETTTTTTTTTTTSTTTTTNDENAPTRTIGNANNNGKTKPTVALLLSGGVDSSVALRLLQQDGYNVTAFYLKIWLEDELSHLGECPWEDDVHMCQQVCDQAGVPLQILSLQDDYQERVMQHVLTEAAAGRTPNPDILCNSRIKFGCFLESINPHEYDFVASGHYAQVIRSFQNNSKEEAEDGTTTTTTAVKLVRAPDPIKDQSYFLCALDQSQLQRILFPIGHLEKFQVRQLANHFELPNRHRPDSQGLCFLGKIKFRDFLELHLGTQEGEIVDAFTGERIGRHDGVWYHTVGQRKGIGKSLFPLATSRGPWYVVAKDPTNNIVYASNQYEEEVFAQARSEFHVENIHWIAGHPPSIDRSHRFWLKIRHGPRLVQGTLDLGSNNNNNKEEGVITLDDKDGGLAPGQYAVFYNDEAECLGGGIISERHWAKFLLDSHDRSQSVPTSLL